MLEHMLAIVSSCWFYSTAHKISTKPSTPCKLLGKKQPCTQHCPEGAWRLWSHCLGMARARNERCLNSARMLFDVIRIYDALWWSIISLRCSVMIDDHRWWSSGIDYSLCLSLTGTTQATDDTATHFIAVTKHRLEILRNNQLETDYRCLLHVKCCHFLYWPVVASASFKNTLTTIPHTPCTFRCVPTQHSVQWCASQFLQVT